jgi:hypothetical protein
MYLKALPWSKFLRSTVNKPVGVSTRLGRFRRPGIVVLTRRSERRMRADDPSEKIQLRWPQER